MTNLIHQTDPVAANGGRWMIKYKLHLDMNVDLFLNVGLLARAGRRDRSHSCRWTSRESNLT